MKKTTAMLTAISLVALANAYAQGVAGGAPSPKKSAAETVAIEACDNPFLPKYLKENLSTAIDEVVKTKVETIKREFEEKLKKEAEKRKYERAKRLAFGGAEANASKAPKYAKIPSFVTVKTMTKDEKGRIVLVLADGTIVKEGIKIFDAKVKSVSDNTIELVRKEGKKIKRYVVNYDVSF